MLLGTISAQAVLRPVENRYLFILETSKEMKREASQAKNVLIQLLYTGVMGQMRAGDTFGVWTYDTTLHAGGIAMQTFTTEDRETITRRTSEYLDSLKFAGEAHLEFALLPALKLATNSPNLTVIIISDGKQAVAGTPFDKEIRALHKKYYDELREAKLPFVTVLVANKGEFISYAVNSALGPIRVPRLPKPPTPTNVVAKVEAPVAPVVKRGESLYLHGALPKKNTTETVPAPTSSAPIPVESPKVETTAATTPTEVGQSPAPVLTPVATIPVPKEPEVASTKPVEVVQTIPTPQPKAPEPAKPVDATEHKTAEPAKEQVSNVATFAVKETPAATPPAVAPPVASTEPTVTPPQPTPTAPAPVVEKKAPAERAIIAETESPSKLRNVLIVIGLLLFFILLVLVLMLRKSKNTHPSLITQSIDKSGP
jgi:hypothetical protein